MHFYIWNLNYWVILVSCHLDSSLSVHLLRSYSKCLIDFRSGCNCVWTLWCITNIPRHELAIYKKIIQLFKKALFIYYHTSKNPQITEKSLSSANLILEKSKAYLYIRHLTSFNILLESILLWILLALLVMYVNKS